jgi:cytosine/adenosine deaminase-related metal-dependent hydrolase
MMVDTASPLTLYADRLIASPACDHAERNVSVRIEGKQIVALNRGARKEYSIADNHLVMPALANAHDHGRGLRRLAYGALDDALEVWLAASSGLHPAVDPYLVAAAAFARMARAGVSATVHCHMPQRFDHLMDEAKAVCRAADEIGIRLAFVVPMVDRNRLVYGGDDAVLAHLNAKDQELLRARWLRPLPTGAEQVALAEEIARSIGSETVDVQFGPFGLEWASDELLGPVAEASRRTGRRIHMHCQETRFQRQWADQRYPDGFVRHLDRPGLLSPRLTLAHCVWLRPEECELLAERGVTLAINTSSNLRLGSGIAPVAEMVRRGVRVAFGVDALSMDDDDDALRELRLAYLLHRGTTLTGGLTQEALFKGAMKTGHEIVDDGAGYGEIKTGAPADLIVLDWNSIAGDVVSTRASEADLILAGANRSHILSVIAGGREIVRDGRILGLDLPSIEAELIAQARAGMPASDAFLPALERYQDAVHRFYQDQQG